MPRATRVSNNSLKKIFTEAFFTVSNEVSPILVTLFWVANDKTFLKNFWQSVQKTEREGKTQ